MQEKDEFEGTGPGAGQQIRYIGIGLYPSPQDQSIEQCLLNIRAENLKVDNFVGKIDRIEQPKWREAIERIPAHWEYPIYLKAKGSDGNVHDYCLQISSHWKSPVLSNVVNYLAGAFDMPEWDGFVEFRTRTRKTAQGDHVMVVSLFGRKIAIPPKFPFNTTTQQWELPEDIRDANGRLDFEKSTIFWHNQYVQIGMKFYGWPEKLLLKNNDLVPPTPYRQPPITSQPQTSIALHQRAAAFVTEMLKNNPNSTLEQFMGYAQKAIETLNRRGGTPADLSLLSIFLNAELVKKPFAAQAGGSWGNSCQWIPKGVDPIEQFDDLPF